MISNLNQNLSEEPRRETGAALRLWVLWLALFGLLPLLSPGSAAQAAPMRRIVLVLDGSLSMIVRDSPPREDGTPAGPTRMDIAVDDLRIALQHLAARPGRWEFRIIAFGPEPGDGGGEYWSYPRESNRFASPAEVAEADTALVALRKAGPRGQSALGAVLAAALAARPTRILLYTDGMPLSSPTDTVPRAQINILDALNGPNGLNTASPKIPIDVVGVGAGIARAHDFLRTLAEESGGLFVVTE